MRVGPPWFSLLLLAAARVSAQSDADVSDPMDLQVHGFVSQGFLVTTDNNYLGDSTTGSFEFTEVGINFTKPIGDDFRIGLQLFSHDLGPTGNYRVTPDWFYLDYRYRDWLGFRAGRVKLPFGLYNEINDIDSARVPVLLPQSTYPILNRDYLLAQTGGELYGYLRLGRAGALDYRLYGGTIFLEADPTAEAAMLITRMSIPYVVGGRLMYETPLEGLRAGISLQKISMDLDLAFEREVWLPLQMAGMLPDDFTGRVDIELPVLLWMASIEYAAHNLQVAAEYSRWYARSESSAPLLFPEAEKLDERLYVLVAYRFNEWFVPSLYYSLYFPDTSDRTGRNKRQQDFALTTRFDLTQNWLLKLELHYLNGTAALSSGLNDNRAQRNLTRDWVMFLAKTTAYF
jgi:hypothetical protein